MGLDSALALRIVDEEEKAMMLKGATVIVGVISVCLLFGWLGPAKMEVSRSGRWDGHRLRVQR